MKNTLLIALALALAAASMRTAHAVFKTGDAFKLQVTGDWRSLDSDDRKFHIEKTREGWEMTAPDLRCTFKIVGFPHNYSIGAEVANTETDCFDEGTHTTGHQQIKWFYNQGLLVMATQITHRDTLGRSDRLSRQELYLDAYKRWDDKEGMN